MYEIVYLFNLSVVDVEMKEDCDARGIPVPVLNKVFTVRVRTRSNHMPTQEAQNRFFQKVQKAYVGVKSNSNKFMVVEAKFDRIEKACYVSQKKANGSAQKNQA